MFMLQLMTFKMPSFCLINIFGDGHISIEFETHSLLFMLYIELIVIRVTFKDFND